MSYVYDGDGRRIQKVATGGATTNYVYDAQGNLAAEYSIAQNPDIGTQYLTADPLGSTRLVTKTVMVNNQPTPSVASRSDYLPFGQETPTTWGNRGSYQPDPAQTMKFTGKERDAETGLDYFGERYFSSAQGRFTSPDSMVAKREWLADPQRWNRYAYVRNNPLRYVDPNGEDLIIYVFYGKDLTDDQKKYLLANMQKIQEAIREKFTKAGVNKVEFRDGSKLSGKQVAKILEAGTAAHLVSATGIGMLNFVNKEIGGSTSSSDMRGDTSSDNRSIVFLDRVNGGPNLTDADTLNFRVSEVAAHELGHSQGFGSDNATINFLKGFGIFGSLMGEGRGTPRMPKQFNTSDDKTQRAIKEINKIGDKTPPKE